jgi:hypothetical protein
MTSGPDLRSAHSPESEADILPGPELRSANSQDFNLIYGTMVMNSDQHQQLEAHQIPELEL